MNRSKNWRHQGSKCWSLFQVDQLREAIEELYYFEFVVDEIPIWGFVGYMEESGFLPHSHKVQTLPGS